MAHPQGTHALQAGVSTQLWLPLEEAAVGLEVGGI